MNYLLEIIATIDIAFQVFFLKNMIFCDANQRYLKCSLFKMYCNLVRTTPTTWCLLPDVKRKTIIELATCLTSSTTPT